MMTTCTVTCGDGRDQERHPGDERGTGWLNNAIWATSHVVDAHVYRLDDDDEDIPYRVKLRLRPDPFDPEADPDTPQTTIYMREDELRDCLRMLHHKIDDFKAEQRRERGQDGC